MMMKADRAGMDRQRLGRIFDAVERHIGADRIAGAVAMVERRGRVVHESCHGLLSREEGTPMRPDALFRIYSMTKPITCVAFMTLFEQGRFLLSDPVARFIPEFGSVKVHEGGDRLRLVDPVRPMTIRDLLTHTSGLTYHWLEYGPVEQAYREAGAWEKSPLGESVANLARLPLAFQPGKAFRYSVAHDVIGRLIEVISGKPLDVYLRTAVFEPLGMKDTAYVVASEDLDRFASMYGSMDIGGRDATSSTILEAGMVGENRLLAGPADSLQSAAHDCLRGGTGLVSTAADYLRFCRMLLGGGASGANRILGRKTLELVTANHLSPDLLPYEVAGRSAPGYGYGLGMRVLMDLGQAQTLGSIGEFGWGGAATTYFWVDPAERMIGVLMAQFQPSSLYPIAQDFRIAAYQAIGD